MEFIHSGKLGDIVFAIPAFRLTGAETFVLHDDQQKGFWRYEPDVIVPLLESQGIKTRVLRGGGVTTALPTWINGNLFRGRFERVRAAGTGRLRNHAERQMLALGLDPDKLERPWLRVTPRRLARVVFCRSARYRPRMRLVNWRAMVDYAKDDGVFLGTLEEWRAWTSEFKVTVPYLPTPDYLEAARIIAGAELFVGNQTGLHAVAAGLGQKIVLERCELIDCCRFGGVFEWINSDDFFGAPIDNERVVKVG